MQKTFKTFIFGLFVALTMSLSTNAQEAYIVNTDVPFWTNTEFELKVGMNKTVNVATLENPVSQWLKGPIGFNIGIGINKYWFPWVGTRFNLEYSNVNLSSMFQVRHVINPHIDFVFPIVEIGTDPWRANFFVGVGYAASLYKDRLLQTDKIMHKHTPTVNLGFDLGFNFFEWGDIAIRPEIVLGDFIDNQASWELVPKLSLVFMDSNPGDDFFGFNEVRVYDGQEVGSLNDNINALKKANEDLTAENEELKNRKPETVVVKESVKVSSIAEPTFVLFEIGKSELRSEMMPNLAVVAEYLKATYRHVEVIGFADRKTGSRHQNMVLSQERANAVAKWLMSQGIDAGRIVIKYEGSNEQHFGVNDWNRAVLIRPL